IIDLEVLLDPVVADNGQQGGPGSAQVLAIEQFKTSVLASALLPIWEQGPDGKGYDISALGSVPPTSAIQVPQWHNVNTDQMARVKKERVAPEYKAVAYLRQDVMSPNDYADEIVEGFQQMYRFFLERRESFQLPGGPLNLFKHVRGRFIF